MKKYRPKVTDKRYRKTWSRVRSSYPEVFRRVIRAGFGEDVRAVVYPASGGFQMIVIYLEGKKRLPGISKAGRMTPFLRRIFKTEIHFARRGYTHPVYYARIGNPELPAVIIVRKKSEIHKRSAYKDADKVSAGIVQAGSITGSKPNAHRHQER